MSKFRRWGLSVVAMAAVSTVVLFVTGWGSAVAAPVASVFVANTSSNPVPVQQQGIGNVNVTNTAALRVQETNTDANGNIKVAQQGSANVNVTNTTLPVEVQGTVMSQQAIPAGAFSRVGVAGDAVSCPGPTSSGVDPGGLPRNTEIYITSFGQVNESPDPASGGLNWYQQDRDESGKIVSSDTFKGLPIFSSGFGTVQETFPQPFALVSGDHQCLKFSGTGTFFVTGYFG